MDIQLNLLGNGLSSLLDIEKIVGDQTMIVKFRNDLDINFKLRLQINRMSFALAKKVGADFFYWYYDKSILREYFCQWQI